MQEPLELRFHNWEETKVPMVSIACLTYNHEDFVEETIESFLKQKTTFKVEVLIHDDASTDNTPSIIKEYEKSFPKLIKAIYQTENQYSKGNHPSIINLERAKGKYIALCEGDDYWTDPLKLQKQVDFLEQNPNYSVCVGGYSRLNENTGRVEEIIHQPVDPINPEGFSFTLKEMEQNWLTKTLTALVRTGIYKKFDFSKYTYYRDIHFYYHLIKDYKAFYFTKNFGVYRIHEGGVNSMKRGRVNQNAAYNCYKELYLHNRDEFTRKMYLKSTLGLLNFNIFNWYKGNGFIKNLRLFKEAFFIVKSPSEWKMIFAVFLKREWKDRLNEKFQKF